MAINESLTHEILSFCKCFKHIFIKGTKSQHLHKVIVEQFSKRLVLFLWLEGATFHWVVGINIKVNVKDIGMSNTNKSYDKRSTKKSEVSFG